MKLLLLGAQGQVGWELQRSLAPLGRVTALGRQNGAGLSGDLARPTELVTTLETLRPDVIINAAAYTAVDRAEDEPEQAELINAQAPALLAREAQRQGAILVHYSTDYVFDGSGQRPWREDDATAPLNVYGRTKRAGEEAILASGCRHLILRTSWVHAARGHNFLHTMLRLAAERTELTVIDDQIGAPTGAELIADVTAHALVALLNQRLEQGLYHLAAAGETSWHGYARHAITSAKRAGLALRTDPEQVHPVSTQDWPTPARRPLNSRLDTRKLTRSLGLQLPPWQQGVERAVQEIAARQGGIRTISSESTHSNEALR